MGSVTIVGAGLAGCEAAFQLAERGIEVVLVDQKPDKRTPAQSGSGLAELVCSNSLRGAALSNAVGLLKEELRRAGSLVLSAADRTRVAAGGALAVDRARFSADVTGVMTGHPRIRVVSEEVLVVPSARPLVIATGPLTGGALAADLERLLGAGCLAYYDAIAPIVSADSIDWTRVFRQSRYDKGDEGEEAAYVNCPFDEVGYGAFVAAVRGAETAEVRAFEEPRYFEGCLPIEVMAARGERTLAFGPMKPVGLVDPKTGRRPFAVVQLRPEDQKATAYNLVGFQTRMTHGEQARVLRTIPGLEGAEFLRFGSVHRNTFIDAPRLLDRAMQLRTLAGVHVAGQLAGVEGYVESAGSGLLCGIFLARSLSGLPFVAPPATTALGGLMTQLARGEGSYQPSNITWAHLPPLEDHKKKKRERYLAMAERALADLAPWLGTIGVEAPSGRALADAVSTS
jgi:methylenetetrahydrofolate--tRNA-(uracil-5-)-methyltransferase